MTMDLFASEAFEPTPAAARARLDAVRPAEYARTRNHLDGAVTRLSPYLTHGLLTLPDVLDGVLRRHPQLPVQHKLVYELAWREYFQHVWHHEGDAIFDSLHEGPLPDDAYARELPADLREACTGVPVIDEAVRELYATGWLHNHARMWLASYVVHIRRLHWRAGADWMFGHLLDGDLASNHLSWQWVAGTGSHKPYLFNAENVARYAPPHWHSRGSVIDTSYETLDAISRGGQTTAMKPRPGGAPKAAISEPACLARPPAGFTSPDAASIRGRPVWLTHPWSLADAPDGLPAGTLRVGVCVAEWHAARPWSEARWRFVGQRLAASCELLWFADEATLRSTLAAAQSVRGIADRHMPGLSTSFRLDAPQRLFARPARRCASFSQFWTQVTKKLSWAAELREITH
jgi:deoxyribodipyrimidine photo-lyase